MTALFENKYTDEQVQYTGIKFFTTDSVFFGVKGFSLHFENHEFIHVSSSNFRLIMVTA